VLDLLVKGPRKLGARGNGIATLDYVSRVGLGTGFQADRAVGWRGRYWVYILVWLYYFKKKESPQVIRGFFW